MEPWIFIRCITMTGLIIHLSHIIAVTGNGINRLFLLSFSHYVKTADRSVTTSIFTKMVLPVHWAGTGEENQVIKSGLRCSTCIPVIRMISQSEIRGMRESESSGFISQYSGSQKCIDMEIVLLKNEFRNELNHVLNYWKSHTIDDVNGGFYGLVDIINIPDTSADKGIVLNSRILWTFSAAFRFTGEKEYKLLADRAYHYIRSCFFDRRYGGVFWSVDFRGNPVNKRKQIYAQAFAIFAFSEYFQITKDTEVLNEALEIYHLIEKHSHDIKRGGYIEAFDAKWDFLEE